MNHLTRSDYAAALALLLQLEPAASAMETFARTAIVAVSDFVASELTTLSVCDLATGRREVVGALGVRLYVDDDRRVGLEHAIAVTLFMDGRTRASLVLHRRGLDFNERDRERLELLRPHLAFLYHLACSQPKTSDTRLETTSGGLAPRPAIPGPVPAVLTPREREVMQWLARGKTDADIAALLSMSPRTVHKHLEHIYVKLGVETRTAAVMRALAMSVPQGLALRSHAVAAALSDH